METLNLIQGSAEWHEFRNDPECYPASEAPAMMGVFPWKSRDQLLDEYTTGERQKVNAATQRVFDRGHKTEEMARPLVESMIDDELFPVVGFDYFDGLKLSASFDGLNMIETVVFEHKQTNEKLIQAIQEKELPEYIKWQLDQQLLVSGAEYVLFVCSDGTLTNFHSMKYYPNPERFERLIIGWQQFKKDLETWVYDAPAEKMEGEKLDGLPVIHYQMDGLTLHSNLDLYQNAAVALVEKSKQPIETDQDFADAAEMVKSFESAESYIKQVQKDVLAEVADIQAFTQKLADIGENIRQARLNTSKQIETRKKEIKAHWINKAQTSFNAFLDECNETLPFPVVGVIPDWENAAKRKQTVSSLKTALNEELNRLKIDIVAAKKLIELNHGFFTEIASDYLFVFNDVEQLIYLDNEPFQNYVKTRIQDYKNDQAEKARLAEESKKAEEMAANDTPPERPETAATEETPPPVQTDVKTPEQQEALNQGYIEPELTREQKLEEIHADLLNFVGKVNAAKVLAAIAENQIRHIKI